jgi:hypothetical protein
VHGKETAGEEGDDDVACKDAAEREFTVTDVAFILFGALGSIEFNVGSSNVW